MNQVIKTIVEFAPLFAFFIAYKLEGLMVATAVLVCVTLVSVAVTYVMSKSLPLMPLISVIILLIFGGLTLLLEDEFFLKIRPTLVNALFAMILLLGLYRKKYFLKMILKNGITMSDQAWFVFSVRWILLFIGLAVLNEVVWRNFNTDFWVQYKVFGVLFVTVVFLAFQAPFLRNNAIKDKDHCNHHNDV